MPPPEKGQSFAQFRDRLEGSIDAHRPEESGGKPLDASRNDFALIAVMRRYFEAKDVANALKERLEATRKEAGDEIGRFYDPRRNALHAEDILAWHQLRKEMDELMSLATRWGRGGNIEDCHVADVPAANAVGFLGAHAAAD